MKINYESAKGLEFREVAECDMFIYGGHLMIKRDHKKDLQTYNAFRVGRPNSGVLIGAHESITPVTEITVH
ncbi:MAG: hypothetical protein ACRCTP_02415 [Aeromonas popoffii]|uniref:hypothetical protein n=1 Tax=Aeromonas popoffii TaxID=70856 RepID=UPI003F3B51A9